MKKPITFRFDPELLECARRSAEADHRSLTNFVETALRRAIEQPCPENDRGNKIGTEHR
jgi:predicted HicB family RNase H-like nuclease